jgi:hypothetical protein
MLESRGAARRLAVRETRFVVSVWRVRHRATVNDLAVPAHLCAGFSRRDLGCHTGRSPFTAAVDRTNIDGARLLRTGCSATKQDGRAGREACEELHRAWHLRNDDPRCDARTVGRALGTGHVERPLAIDKRHENLDARMEAKRIPQCGARSSTSFGAPTLSGLQEQWPTIHPSVYRSIGNALRNQARFHISIRLFSRSRAGNSHGSEDPKSRLVGGGGTGSLYRRVWKRT